mgnify:CR=1 FL=1
MEDIKEVVKEYVFEEYMEDDEEELEALTELEEYMRVAVITIHQDMLPR